MREPTFTFERDLKPITKGEVALPNFSPMEPVRFVNNIAAGGHMMQPVWGYALINGHKEWAQFFLTGAGMGSPPRVYGGGGICGGSAVRNQYTALVYPEVNLGDGVLDLIAEVRFTYLPAYPGRGPSYSDGGLPPEPESIEDREVISLTIDTGGGNRKPIANPPKWLCEWIAENADESDLLEVVPTGPDTGSARHHLEPIPLEARLREVRAALDARDTRRAHEAIERAKTARHAGLRQEIDRRGFAQ